MPERTGVSAAHKCCNCRRGAREQRSERQRPNAIRYLPCEPIEEPSISIRRACRRSLALS